MVLHLAEAENPRSELKKETKITPETITVTLNVLPDDTTISNDVNRARITMDILLAEMYSPVVTGVIPRYPVISLLSFQHYQSTCEHKSHHCRVKVNKYWYQNNSSFISNLIY